MQITSRDREYAEIMKTLLEAMGNNGKELQKWFVDQSDEWGMAEKKLMFIRKKEFFADLQRFLENKTVENNSSIDEKEVDFLGFSQRTVNSLYALNCRTVGDMKKLTLMDLKKATGVGIVAIRQVGEYLGWDKDVLAKVKYQ